MVNKKLTESFTQTDPSTKNWKMRFAAARMTYEDGKLIKARVKRGEEKELEGAAEKIRSGKIATEQAIS